jgi:transcriptional regulator with XRE-family HTH domain
MSDKARDAKSAVIERIERIRRELGLTVEDLADRSKVDRSTLDSLLRERSDVDVSVFGRLAEALGVDPGELLEGIEWVPDGHGGGEYRVSAPRR